MNAGPLKDMLSIMEGRAALSNHLISRNSPPPVNRQKVEYYVRLGYPQEIVESTISSMGPAAHDNDIMNRLIKRGAVASPNRSVVIPEEPTPPASVMVAPVGAVERPPQNSQNLRPIVVDGSNVAMRYAELQQCCMREMCVSMVRPWLVVMLGQ